MSVSNFVTFYHIRIHEIHIPEAHAKSWKNKQDQLTFSDTPSSHVTKFILIVYRFVCNLGNAKEIHGNFSPNGKRIC